MGDEWEVLRNWVEELCAAAPDSKRVEIQRLLLDFERRAARWTEATVLFEKVFRALPENARAKVERIRKERENESRRDWGWLFSRAADLSACIDSARGKSAATDVELDRRIAFQAVFARTIGAEPVLKRAILDAADGAGVKFNGVAEAQREALYRRVKRLIEDPKENIPNRVAFFMRKHGQGQ